MSAELSRGLGPSTVEQMLSSPADSDDAHLLVACWKNVGSISMLVPELGLGGNSVGGLLFGAHRVWIDELDAATDASLLAIRRLGPVRLRVLRRTLDAYYWRGEANASRRLWKNLEGRLLAALEQAYLPERRRARKGLAFVSQVLRGGRAATRSGCRASGRLS